MGRMAALYHSLGLLIIFVINIVFTFNIDTNIPVIKRGPKNSYFGFSIAQHQVVDSSNATTDYLLLVGAPLLNNQASSVPDTGGLYSCKAQTDDENCLLQSTIEDSLRVENNGSRSGQWLGSTVRSTGRGGMALVCAFRYSVSYNPLGRCVLLDQILNFYREIRQCENDGRENEGKAICQVGASAEVLPDGELLLGAPGAVDWTGMVSKIYQGRSFGKDKSWHDSPVFHRISPGSNQKLPPIDKNSYMGFSVIAGNFKGYTNRLYAGGAPRSNSTGQVVLFFNNIGKLDYHTNNIIDGEQAFSAFGYDLTAIDFDSDGFDELVVGSPMYVETKKRYVGGAVYIFSSDSQLNKFSPFVKLLQPMTENRCMLEKCLDARFGHTVSKAGDINLDGYQDLVVGAPYDNRGVGAIYIYHGSAAGIVEKYAQKITPSELPAPLQSTVTFGHALTGGLDMDSNGYPDIAVGAYENNTVVMLRTRPIVRLTSKITVDPPKFNLSKAPGCPFDNPVLVIKPMYCVQLQICLNFSAKPLQSFSTPQEIKVMIFAEKDRVLKRVFFKEAEDKVHSTEYTETLSPRAIPKCVRRTVYLEDNVKDQLTPISFHVNYSLITPDFPTGRRRRQAKIPDINKYPVLQTDGSIGGSDTMTTVLTQVDFVKKCGSDEVCQSRLSLDMRLNLEQDTNGMYQLNYGEVDRFEVEVELRNTGEPAYEPTFYLYGPDELTYQSSLYVEPKEKAGPCAGVDKVAVCTFDNPFGDPERLGDGKIIIKLILSASKVDPSIPKLNITGIFNTTSDELTPGNDKFSIMINVVTKADIKVFGSSYPLGDIIYKGQVRGESAITTEDDIGPAINHTYTVLNVGPGTISSAELYIDWPYEKEDNEFSKGKWLLYLLQVTVVETVKHTRLATCEHNPSILNPLNYKTFIPHNSGPEYTITRRRREINQEEGTTKAPASQGTTAENKRKDRNYVTLNCDKGAKCHRIKCSIGKLDEDQSVKFVLRSRLWESTLLQDYPDAEEVRIQSNAEVFLPKKLNVKQKDVTDDKAYATTYTIPLREKAKQQAIEWWIILVAVLAGVILLVILIFILWKCNFFKRLKPDGGYVPTYSGEIKKNKDYDNLEY